MMNPTATGQSVHRLGVGVAVALGVLVLFAGGYLWRRASRSSALDPRTYEATVTVFYRALASLQVGLLEDAKTGFSRATEIAPNEPAAWANLGLAEIRLGDLDQAAQAVQRAAVLAPASSDAEFLFGQLERSRGRLDEGIAHFRRAVELEPRGLRPRAALAEEIERAGGP